MRECVSGDSAYLLSIFRYRAVKTLIILAFAVVHAKRRFTKVPKSPSRRSRRARIDFCAIDPFGFEVLSLTPGDLGSAV
jgi:hypothetical protein